MDQVKINNSLLQAHQFAAARLATRTALQQVLYINELEQQLIATENRNEHLETVVEGLLVDYAARCREVLNLRMVLRSEQLDKHAERLGLLEEFTNNGIASQYYHYNDSFELSEVKLSRIPK